MAFTSGQPITWFRYKGGQHKALDAEFVRMAGRLSARIRFDGVERTVPLESIEKRREGSSFLPGAPGGANPYLGMRPAKSFVNGGW